MEAESETRYNIIKMRMKSRPPRAVRPPRGLSARRGDALRGAFVSDAAPRGRGNAGIWKNI
jgi:hypothetical protein